MNISIIVPVYNVEPYIERCIRSIMNQTFTEGVECILINDCTPDNSIRIVQQLINEYKGNIQFRILSNEHNQGIASVRNIGLQAAKGTYIQYIDSDDYVEPDMLETLYKKACGSSSDILVYDYYCENKNQTIKITSTDPIFNVRYKINSDADFTYYSGFTEGKFYFDFTGG